MQLYRDFTTQAQIDAQYNAGAAVPDGAARLAAFAERSARVRAARRCVLDVPYGPTREETLDIFPADPPGAPVFVFLHGGYWRAFTSKEFSAVAEGLLPRGITTVVVNYALCPRVTIDEIVRQVRAALAWVLRRIGEHGGDPARVAVGGHSAGGHLTAMALATDWEGDYGLPRDPFVAALPISGLYDLEPLRWSYLQPMIQLDDGVVRRNSPLFKVRPCRTPSLIAWGADESAEFERQGRAFAQAWEGAGNPCEALPLAGANHFTVLEPLADEGGALAAWLSRRLGRERA